VSPEVRGELSAISYAASLHDYHPNDRNEVQMCMHNYLIFTVVAGSELLLDQATKLYIDHNMALYTSIPVIGSIFSITYVRNPGQFSGYLQLSL